MKDRLTMNVYESIMTGLQEAVEYEKGNLAVEAMHFLQVEMQGEVERTGLVTDEDVQQMVKEIRAKTHKAAL